MSGGSSSGSGGSIAKVGDVVSLDLEVLKGDEGQPLKATFDQGRVR